MLTITSTGNIAPRARVSAGGDGTRFFQLHVLERFVLPSKHDLPLQSEEGSGGDVTDSAGT